MSENIQITPEGKYIILGSDLLNIINGLDTMPYGEAKKITPFVRIQGEHKEQELETIQVNEEQ